MTYTSCQVRNVPTPVLTVIGTTAQQCTFVNTDTVNTVWLGNSRTLAAGESDTIPVPPLGSAPLDTTDSTWAISTVSTPVIGLILPGTGGWTASPVQIQEALEAAGLATEATQLVVASNAATTADNVAGTTTAVGQVKTALGTPAQTSDINGVKTTLGTPAQTADVNGVKTTLGTPAQTTDINGIPVGVYNQGVPAANKSSILDQQTGTAIAANTSISLGTFSITQPSYEISFNPVMPLNTNGEVWLKVTMTWSDATSGLIVAPPETWYVASSQVVGNVKVVGTGQAKGNQVQIQVTNPNTAFGAVIDNFVMMQNSIPRNRDDWRNPTNNFGGIATFSTAAQDPDAMVLFSTAPSVAAGTPVVRLLPLFCGIVSMCIVVPGAGGTVTISESASAAASAATALWSKVYPATATTDNVQFALPRVNCTLSIANATGTNTWSIRAQIAEQMQ